MKLLYVPWEKDCGEVGGGGMLVVLIKNRIRGSLGERAECEVVNLRSIEWKVRITR